jgi:C1A family cysteine protease
MKFKIFIINLLLLTILLPTLTASDSIEQLNKIIQQKHAKWTPQESWVTKLSKEERLQLCGAFTEPPIDGEERFIELPMTKSLPASFDWRNNNGNWVTPVRSQGSCGSCWDFSAIAQIEAWWNITNNLPGSKINLSEQYILSCANVGGCDGSNVYRVLQFAQSHPIPHEQYLTYKADDEYPCDSLKTGWETDAVTIPGWGFITLEDASVNNIKNALLHHPVSVSYDVYTDFMSYGSGIYEHVSGDYEAGHAVLIVGWNDDDECWIVKNSWGTNWGENGYFRIKWGQCNMGKHIPYIYDEMTGYSSLAFDHDSISIEIQAGSNQIETISVENTGSNSIELYTTDSQSPVMFHPTTYKAQSNYCWWCGSSDLNGYANHWLQYLQTPPIDLQTSTSPKLNFKAKWSIEGTGGTTTPWDGWDGWNVFISTDNGANYDVLTPVYPEYTCQSLWAFGEPEQGWDMGPGIAGWAGYSNHWEDIEFDLSAYSGNNIIIRFAFASDKGFSSEDDQSVNGLFIEDICVSDNNITIFADSAYTDTEMEVFGWGDIANEWLDVQIDNNIIPSGNTIDLNLEFNAPLNSGNYSGSLGFLSNDTNTVFNEIPVYMTVVPADNDISVDNIILSGFVVNPLLKNPIGANIRNNGITEKTNIEVTLTSNTTGHTTSETIELIDPGEVKRVWFNPSWLGELSDVDFSVSTNISDDISINNHNNISCTVYYLIDNFEVFNNFWTMDESWDFTTNNPYQGIYSIMFQYISSDTSCAYYKKGINIKNNDLEFQLEVKNSGERATSKLFIDLSYDYENWILSDSISVSGTEWKNHSIEFSPDYSQEYAYFRLRGSNINSPNIITIDNLFVYPKETTNIYDEIISHTPDKFGISSIYPNPFNPKTNISFQVAKSAFINMKIYNLRGEVIKTLVDKFYNAGYYTVDFTGKDLPSGIYFCQFNANDFFETKKMMLVK